MSTDDLILLFFLNSNVIIQNEVVVTEEMLRYMFGKHGKVLDVSIRKLVLDHVSFDDNLFCCFHSKSFFPHRNIKVDTDLFIMQPLPRALSLV